MRVVDSKEQAIQILEEETWERLILMNKEQYEMIIKSLNREMKMLKAEVINTNKYTSDDLNQFINELQRKYRTLEEKDQW